MKLIAKARAGGRRDKFGNQRGFLETAAVLSVAYGPSRYRMGGTLQLPENIGQCFSEFLKPFCLSNRFSPNVFSSAETAEK
jgi:hypothetical protein